MSSVTLTISQDYGYVILAAASTFLLNNVHGFYTGSFRKKAQVPYPNAYASAEQAKANADAYSFNCAQRAHANFTENHTSMLGALFIAGLTHPRIAAGLGALWSVSRLLFMTGYTNRAAGAAGKGRYRGSAFWIAQLALMGMAGWSGLELVMGW